MRKPEELACLPACLLASQLLKVVSRRQESAHEYTYLYPQLQELVRMKQPITILLEQICSETDEEEEREDEEEEEAYTFLLLIILVQEERR